MNAPESEEEGPYEAMNLGDQAARQVHMRKMKQVKILLKYEDEEEVSKHELLPES